MALLASPPPIAHTGNWGADLVFSAPVIVLVLWFLVITVRDKRRASRMEDGEDGEDR